MASESHEVALDVFLLEGMDSSLPVDFSSLPKLQVVLGRDDVLFSVLEEVHQQIGRAFGFAHYYFLHELDSRDGRRQARHPSAYVGQDGELKWASLRLENVTVDDLERAKQHGFFDGDPHCLVIDNRPYGNGGPVYWADVFEFLLTLGSASGAAYAIGRLGSDVIDRIKQLVGLLKRHYRRWMGKGAVAPLPILITLLERRAWRSGDLAGYLALDVGEVEVLLEALGYSRIGGDLFQRSEDDLSAFVRQALIDEYLHRDPIQGPKDFNEWLEKRKRESPPQ